MTNDEKLTALDRMIEDLRWARSDPAVPENPTYHALKEIAAQIRAETPPEIGKVLQAMTFQVETARRAKARSGHFEIGHMQTIAEALCGRWWPTVRAALEKFEGKS